MDIDGLEQGFRPAASTIGAAVLRSTILSLLILPALTGSATEASVDQEISSKALKVLDRTKVATGTYSLYLWNRVTPPDREPIEEWSAEFHSGDRHRVETPRDRVIADCRKRTGVALSLRTGEIIEGPQVASAACGINTNAWIIRAEWLGPVQTRFGQAERVRVTDRENVRQYDVAAEGMLLHTTYWQAGDGGRLLLKADAVELEPTLPATGMFDRASLKQSFVPDEYKVAPGPG